MREVEIQFHKLMCVWGGGRGRIKGQKSGSTEAGTQDLSYRGPLPFEPLTGRLVPNILCKACCTKQPMLPGSNVLV